MIDTSIAVSGVVVVFSGQRFEMVKAGFSNDIPYAEVKPRNETVERVIFARIKRNMPFPFAVQEIQDKLTKTK